MPFYERLLRFAEVREGKLHVVPGKTPTTSGVRLRIGVSDALAALIARCRDDGVSPYLVHRLPERARPSDKRAKDRQHHTQLLPEQITREFQEIRDALGVTGKTAPTFHEIRSLGAARLRDSGWTEEQVQQLHEAPWTDVASAPSLPANRV